MSSDPDSYYEDEYFEEVGRQELITQALKDISEDGIRYYLGTYGDAIDARVKIAFRQAKYASQSGFPHYAVVGAVTVIELVTRFMLVRPLLQGAFLSDDWAQLLVKYITAGKTAQERDILPSMLEFYGIKIKEMNLSDGSPFWKTLVTTVIRKRNDIVHEGETATAEEATIAIECATILQEQVVSQIADKMGFVLGEPGCWHKIGKEGEGDYDPADPFE